MNMLQPGIPTNYTTNGVIEPGRRIHELDDNLLKKPPTFKGCIETFLITSTRKCSATLLAAEKTSKGVFL